MGVGGTDAHTRDFRETVLRQHRSDSAGHIKDVRMVVFVFGSLQDLVLQHFAVRIHQCDIRVGAAYVNAYGQMVHRFDFFI